MYWCRRQKVPEEAWTPASFNSVRSLQVCLYSLRNTVVRFSYRKPKAGRPHARNREGGQRRKEERKWEDEG
jgi:hypothetical protein